MKIKCKVSKDYCVCSLDDVVCDGRHFCECGGSWNGETGQPLLYPREQGTWQDAITLTEGIEKAGPLLAPLVVAADRIVQIP